MTSKDSVARKLQELIDSQSNFQLGQLTSSASTGGTVTAKLPNGKTVTAKAGNDCSGGQCSLFRLEDGTYIAMSGNASTLISQQTTTFRQSRANNPTKSGKYIKVLFSKIVGGSRVFYIGGDRLSPKKVHETSESSVVKAAYISATGEGEDKWVVALALQAGTAVTIWHITATESGKRSWTDTTDEIFPLLTYNGFGMWSAGTFIAPTMDTSEVVESVGESVIKTSTFTVNRPSFVLGTGQVKDINISKSRTIKKAEVCYDTRMRSGECVNGPMTTVTVHRSSETSLGLHGDKGAWQKVKDYRDAIIRAGGRSWIDDIPQSKIDSLLPLGNIPPVTGETTVRDGRFNSPSMGSSKVSNLYAGVVSWQVGDTLWSLEYAAPFLTNYGTTYAISGWGWQRSPSTPSEESVPGPRICQPATPVRVIVSCAVPSYDTVIPGGVTRTISGGYDLTTLSFLVNNGEYSDRPGTISLKVVGTGVASGALGLTMTTVSTYSYRGESWVDRGATASCSSTDVSTQVDVDPPTLSARESREVCLAVGINGGDRLTFRYTQMDNDRKEEIYWNGVNVETPLGFVSVLSQVGTSYSSPSFFTAESEYSGVGEYPESPKYSRSIGELNGLPTLLIKMPSASFLPDPSSVPGVPSSVFTLGTIHSVSAASAAVVGGKSSGVISIQSMSFSEAAQPKPLTGSAVFTGKIDNTGATSLALSLNGFTGLLTLPSLGYADLADPYTRSMSIQQPQPDTANKYQTPFLNVIRPLGDPAYCFYDNGRILVSAFPSSEASYCYREGIGVILSGKFTGSGSFSWNNPETRDIHPLGKERGDSTFIVHSTTAWF